MTEPKIRIVIVGSGVAGSLLCAGLRNDERFEIICLEKAASDQYAGSGTGLNVGPNAIKTLQHFFPDIAESVLKASLPWKKWHVCLTNGQVLLDFPISDVADNPGIRIRWAELYRQLRLPVIDFVKFNVTVTKMGYQSDSLSLTYQQNETGQQHTIEDIHLIVGGDGRFSLVRDTFFQPTPPRMAGMGICRLLAEPDGKDFPVDDYGQWFNGPNRLLGFRLPGNAFYTTATFPIAPESQIPEAMKDPKNIRALFLPAEGKLCEEATFLLECIERQKDDLHWARFAESDFHWTDERKQVLLLGDASHAMLPTLGQGATQAIEDACVASDALRIHADPANPKQTIHKALTSYRERREVRVNFTSQFTNEASDTLIEGTNIINDTLRKSRRPFTDNLKKLYRDTPTPQFPSTQP